MSDQAILRKPDLRSLMGISDATIRRLMQDAGFPKPIQLAPRSVGWRASSVYSWLDARPAAAVSPVKSRTPR